jgi:ribosomal protein L31
MMKKEIHPEYVDCTVTCACGNTFKTKSNKSEIRIDICDKCHPFFTGSEKIVDSAGRVEKFKKKYAQK